MTCPPWGAGLSLPAHRQVTPTRGLPNRLARHPREVLIDIAVAIPLVVAAAAARDGNHKTNTLLHQPAGQQAAASVIVRLFLADSVHIERLLGLVRAPTSAS